MNKSETPVQTNNGFTLGQVQVECAYPIQRVTSLTVKQKLNEHAQLHLEGILWEAQAADWIDRVTGQDPIAVYAENEEGRVLLFSGVVTGVEMVSRNRLRLVRIQAASYSSLLGLSGAEPFLPGLRHGL